MEQVNSKFEKGCKCFDEQEFFEAHEVWEELWMEADGKRRSYLQALIQVAVALHHLGNNNLNGAEKLSASSYGHFEKALPGNYEVDVAKIMEHLENLEAYILKKRANPSLADSFELFKLPRVL